MRGDDKKLIVEDLGPYTYMEKFEKVNVTFHKNHTISYRVSIPSILRSDQTTLNIFNHNRKIELTHLCRKSLKDTSTTELLYQT